MLFVALGTCFPVRSAVNYSPVGAGQLGNQLRQSRDVSASAPAIPVLTLPPDTRGDARAPQGQQIRIMLHRVIFTGNSTIPDPHGVSSDDLQKAVVPWTGKYLYFSDLQKMTEAVTQLYRNRGLLVARAILPPQTVKDGVLTIKIIPGRYDSEQITNTSGLRDSVARHLIHTTTPQGDVVTRRQLEREALLLSELPGVNAQVTMKAGSLQGTTTPEITLTPGQKFGGYVGLDNQGDPTTGRSRVMTGGYANNLLGLGDQLRVDLLDAWEKSDLFNGALDYSLPAGGAYGTRVGANYSHLNYRYNLSKLGFKGYSDNWGLYATWPWIRTSRARVDVRLDGGQQFLTDSYPFATESGSSGGRKTVSLGALSMTGSVADLPGGLTGFGFSGTAGNVDLRSDISRSFSEQAGSGGHFARLNWQLNHDQQVWGPFSVYAGAKGQLANHNMDASQKFLMGGPSAVRAYDIGDGSVDQGVVGTAEVRIRRAIPVLRWPGSAPQLTVAAFYDQGRGEQYRNNNNGRGGHLADSNNMNLAGAGLYATVADAGSYALTMTWARRTGNADPNAVHDDRDRFWISAVKTF
ncbi:ShlB/FhaC/HecB family hemolysin secretion/activation protein [Salmonella enterica subsp. enterica serovar Chester]